MLRHFIRESFFGYCYEQVTGKYLFASSAPQLKWDDDSIETLEGASSKEINSIGWDGPDDKENPYNWSMAAKLFVAVQLSLLQFSVYMCAAIYTPGAEELMKEFDINYTLAMLPLTVYVIGYGMGTMIFSPFSENPLIGRNSVYAVTTFIFVVLQIPIALSKNIASFAVLRFLAGFFGSTPLANVGASFTDMVSAPFMPVGLGVWGVVSLSGPALGPFFGSLLINERNWRWTFWFTLIVSGSTLCILVFFLPETHADTLLYRKYKRIVKQTGKTDIYCEAKEKINKDVMASLKEMLWRPLVISIVEPVVLLINIYICLVYSVLYLWFEAFPIVFSEVHHFTKVQTGACYLSLSVGVGLGTIPYLIYLYKNYTKALLRGDTVYPEVFIPLSIVGNQLMTAGILIFGWTASAKLHWFPPMIGAALCGASMIINFQSFLNYLGMSFPRYVASVFASNNLVRSVVAGVFPLFGRSLYKNLSTPNYPVAWGASVLGFLSLAMSAIPVLFYLNGPKLRARSDYAG
ncbi:hypothetical protein PGUG_03271 [Meyerozyma guilliermondii ATCC 6260]|uniref:Major facilitator superfamily (MFS) profile domain-containing protein n=1 Tax=Meyerozyma guilliermondii (strain ATCC 6260 / CBS 566 / DSM 6381 / JCM 1539 / NBRC 10279 / NRRL Y-324) TaxID=294746 RepID=A5DJ20_PICGU|nr:uncharacterized protein PGUG_03271 [Meyerozyma guilliermondii ATCC 6260]EDK39173.2 hypothetical protein PGUG_03271 [Meyerozyma guilliermondii ATCC 6260]